jgi:arginase
VSLRFVAVPQWQGSPSTRAMRLAEGVAALRTDLPASATTEVAVPLEAGDDQGTGISRYASVRLVRERTANALGELDGPFVIVGGDCGVSAAGIAAAVARHPETCVVWFDAHPDLNSAQTSPSGAFAGMVLRAAVDAGEIAADRVILAGARSWDPGEEAFATEAGIQSLSVAELADPEGLVAAVTATGADAVYVHVDLDVLDPASLAGLLDPEPFGLEPSALVAAIRALRARLPLAGATLAAYAPGDPGSEQGADDAATILRIIAALD